MEFYAVTAFAEAIRPHFDPVALASGMEGPSLEASAPFFPLSLLVRYDGPATALLLYWDVRERLFGCHIARRWEGGVLDGDEDWLGANEILAVRGERARWVTADDVADVDAEGFALAMGREADNLRDFCADVLRGDWSVQREVQAWHATLSGQP